MVIQPVRPGDAVAYIGPDEGPEDDPLWAGHPGRVVDVGDPDGTVVVDYVAKGAECISAACLELLPEDEYRRRAQRLLAFRHPLRDQTVGWGPLLDRNHVP